MWITLRAQYFGWKNFIFPYLVSNICAGKSVLTVLSTFSCGNVVDKFFLTPNNVLYIISMLASLLGILCPNSNHIRFRKVSEQPIQQFSGNIVHPLLTHVSRKDSKGYASWSRSRTRHSRASSFHVFNQRRKYKWQKWHISLRKGSAQRYTASYPEWAPRAAERFFPLAGAKAESRSQSDRRMQKESCWFQHGSLCNNEK